MGQKVNPFGFRLGIINDWRTRWYSEKNYASYLAEDIRIRRHLTDKLFRAGISKIEIERTEQQVKIIIYASRPGIVIGKKGAEVDKLRADLEAMTGKRIRIDIQEVVSPEADAKLIAENVAQQLESRFSFRRAMKKAVQAAMSSGVKGIRISSAGRLGGGEMARTEWYREGQVPLHTLRADIDYGIAEANTKSGKIGVKVWIYKGEVLPEKEIKEEKLEEKERVPEKKEKAAAKETKIAEKTKLAEETKIMEETTEKVSVKEEIEEKGEPGAASKKG